MSIQLRVIEYARHQAGVFSRLQVIAVGGSDRTIHRQLANGTWIRVAEGVYRLAAYPESLQANMWAATLAPGAGAVVSHEAAAAMHGIATFRPGPVTVTVPHATSRIDHLATVHQSRRLYPEHVTAIEGLRVTTIARTVIDLAAIHRRGRMEIVVDDPLASRKLTLAEL